MRKLMNAIMLSCRKATEFVEKKRHCRLAKMERVRLKMHLSICKDCSNYAKQTGFIDRLLNGHQKFSSANVDTSSLEKRIITDIQSKL